MDEKDLNILRSLGYIITEKTLWDITLNENPVMSIFPDDKYIQFHDEYTQIAWDIPELQNLIKFLKKKGFAHNHS